MNAARGAETRPMQVPAGKRVAARERLSAGLRIGDYTVTRMLGAGGMGIVYEVQHDALNRRAAMKVLRAEYASSPTITARFLQEARAVNVIRHRNIIDIYDHGERDDGSMYLVMEFLEGRTLEDLISRRMRLSPALIVKIFSQVMDALAAAHDKQIVHRDLKPDNVFLIERGGSPHFVKLLDFGIAQFRGWSGGDRLTCTGTLIGTPHFMSPEQARAQEVDARSDIFSLGVMMYRATTGRLPFVSNKLSTLLHKITTAPAPPLREAAPDIEIPRWLEEMIDRAMQKDPNHRYQRMQDMLAALRAVDGGPSLSETVSTTPEIALPVDANRVFDRANTGGVAPQPSRARSRGWSRATVTCLALIATAALGVVALGSRAQPNPAAEPDVRHNGDVSSQNTPGPRAATPELIESNAASQTNQIIPADRASGAEHATLAALIASGAFERARAQARAQLEADLASGAPEQRSAVVEAIALVGATQVTSLLREALAGPPQLRLEAARAIRDLGLRGAAPDLRQASRNSGRKLRAQLVACLVSLSERGEPEELDVLERALASDPSLALDAAVSLARTGRAARARPVLQRLMARATPGTERWRRAAHGLLSLGDEAARKALVDELTEREGLRGVRAAALLVGRDDGAAIDYLERATADADERRRAEAAWVLATRDRAEPLALVPALLASKSARARQLGIAIAARLSARRGRAHQTAIAEIATRDRDPRVRVTARVALLTL